MEKYCREHIGRWEGSIQEQRPGLDVEVRERTNLWPRGESLRKNSAYDLRRHPNLHGW